ncbi:MAG: glutathione transferase GstA [Burkholderiales bacterium]|nr:glutathione transferase GstA [Burkholderiales bacterium]
MKLYYSPGACSLSPHIALHEAGLPFELVLVSTKTHKLADGTDYYSINPKGYVPLLEFDDGTRLTEGPAIVQWIADQVPDRHLAPPAGTIERYRLMEWLNFISTEVHKQFGVIYNPAMPEEAKTVVRTRLNDRFGYINRELAGKDFVMGSTFTVADCYLYVMAFWTRRLNIDVTEFTNFTAYAARVEARPSVQAAMKHEGLLT